MARRISPSRPDLSRWAPWLVALATLLVFLPSIGNDFVNWDDDRNFLDNPNYRGLGLTQVRWAFNAFVLGQNALANCLLRQGQAAEAVPHYEAALETAPTTPTLTTTWPSRSNISATRSAPCTTTARPPTSTT